MVSDPHTTDAAETQGGSGGASQIGRGVRDVKLLALALEQMWAVTAEDKVAILGRLMQIIRDPESRPRSIVAASNAVIAATRQNTASVDTCLRAQAQDDIDVRLREIEGKLAHAISRKT
jgi:hypothetical protein